MRVPAKILFWIGLLCFVPTFFPTIRHRQIPHGTENTFTLGLPASPWLVASRTETKQETRQDKLSSFSSQSNSNMNFELINGSFLMGVAGAALLAISKHSRKDASPAE